MAQHELRRLRDTGRAIESAKTCYAAIRLYGTWNLLAGRADAELNAANKQYARFAQYRTRRAAKLRDRLADLCTNR